jgi:uncharacterized protein (DUF4415 family)
MSRKSGNIVSFTVEELNVKRAREETQSDWKRAAALPVPDGSDPDDAIEPIDWATTELPLKRPKVHASLRLDADMLDWFKAQGRGYQTKINAILRSCYQSRAR